MAENKSNLVVLGKYPCIHFLLRAVESGINNLSGAMGERMNLEDKLDANYDDGFEFDTNLAALSKKIGAWSSENLPAEGTVAILQKVHGIHEEIGELFEALLMPAGEGCDKLIDALGDICIYMLDFCDKFELDVTSFSTLGDYRPIWEDLWLKEGDVQVLKNVLVIWSGKLSRGLLKTTQNIRNTEDHHAIIEEAVYNILMICWHFARAVQEDLYRIIQNVADSVLARDWIANPDTAHIQPDEA